MSVHNISDINLLDLYEFARKAPWEKGLCNTSAQLIGPLNGFSSTVGLSLVSANPFQLPFTRAVVRFQANQKPRKRADRRIITFDTLVPIGQSSPLKEAFLLAHEIDSGSSDKSIVREHILFDPTDYMNSSSSHEIAINEQKSFHWIIQHGNILKSYKDSQECRTNSLTAMMGKATFK